MSAQVGSNSNFKLLVMIAWFLAVCSVIVALVYQDRFFARTAPTVAEIAKTRGDISFRSENKVRWNEALRGTLLADGDRVSTGRASTTEIRFNDGRKLSLSEESQVVISTISHSDSGVTFLVNLVKGSVVADAKADCRKCRDIIVRAGGESFSVGKGKKEGFYRDPNTNKLARLKGARRAPVSAEPVAEPVESEEPKAPAKEPVKEKVKEPKKPLLASASGFEFSVRPPSEGPNLWTHRSMGDLFGARLSIPVAAPVRRPPAGKFVPLIEVSNAEGTKSELIAGSSPTDTAVSLALVKLRMIASQRLSGAKQYVVTIRGGIRIFDGPKPLDSIGGTKMTLTINSIGEPLGTPLALGFDRLKYENPQGNWIAPKTVIPVSTAPVQVTLFGAGDFSRMLPFAVGASRFGTLVSSQTVGSVANIVRDGYIIAQVTRYTSVADVKAITNALGASFAFVGSRGLYQYSSGNAQDNVITLIEDLLDKGKVLYFYKNKKLYPVNRTFIKNSKEVANFLGKQANMFFTEKVEIIN